MKKLIAVTFKGTPQGDYIPNVVPLAVHADSGGKVIKVNKATRTEIVEAENAEKALARYKNNPHVESASIYEEPEKPALKKKK